MGAHRTRWDATSAATTGRTVPASKRWSGRVMSNVTNEGRLWRIGLARDVFRPGVASSSWCGCAFLKHSAVT